MKKKFDHPLKMKFIVLIFIPLCIPLPVLSSQENWGAVAGKIEKALHEAVSTYERGKKDQAMEMVADAYFGIFEGEKANMEIAVRKFINIKKASELEKGFSDLRKAIKDGTKSGYFKKQTSTIIEAVNAAAKELDRKGVELNFEF